MRSLSVLVRMVVLILLVVPAQAAMQNDAAILPTVSFYSLSKSRLTLPQDLHSNRNLILLYFQLTQQANVDAWNDVLDRWHGADPALISYTSLVSPSKNFLSRWWQNASLRSASPNAAHWSTTLPLYVDRSAFEHALGIPSESEAVLLLTDRRGRVLHRVSGPPTNAARATMRAALIAAGAPATLSAAAVTQP